MNHTLDNPAWHALTSGNSNLALGSNTVKFFDSEVSPFAGMVENTQEYFSELFELIPANRPVLLMSTTKMELYGDWKLLGTVEGLQMIHETDELPELSTDRLVPLTDLHIPQMVALTKLTNPGPFANRTIEFGHYNGVLESDKLVAMAGQRLYAEPYTEISAVCTHPDHLGKGYARQLLIAQVKRMKAAGTIPYLHVRGDNARAIAVYESLGFKRRADAFFYVVMKEQ